MKIVAFEGERFDVEITRGIPQFLTWCDTYGCVRCDVNRASDLIAVLGRSPTTLQCVEVWQAGRGNGFITSMQPDEVVTSIREFADACLGASNEEYARLQSASFAGNQAAIAELAELEKTSTAVLQAHGFKVADDGDPLGPSSQPGLSDAQRRAIANDPIFGDLSGHEFNDADFGWEQTAPKNWEGF